MTIELDLSDLCDGALARQARSLERLRRDQLRERALLGEREAAAVAAELLRRLLRRREGAPHNTKPKGVRDAAAIRAAHGVVLSIDEPDDELVPNEGAVDEEAA